MVSAMAPAHESLPARHSDYKFGVHGLEPELARLREELAYDKITVDPNAGLHPLCPRFGPRRETTRTLGVEYIAKAIGSCCRKVFDIGQF